MDAPYYCEAVNAEMVGLKARLYDLFSSLDSMPPSEREKLYPSASEIHAMVREISSKLNQLRRECPREFSAFQQEIEAKTTDLKQKIRSFEAAHLKSM
ncbi:MAG: hypothetical protein QME75_15370 [Deltaproteobacteria bacterium]|nr:hypothetical protein [Deltaproteobacteria bacterium]